MNYPNRIDPIPKWAIPTPKDAAIPATAAGHHPTAAATQE